MVLRKYSCGFFFVDLRLLFLLCLFPCHAQLHLHTNMVAHKCSCTSVYVRATVVACRLGYQICEFTWSRHDIGNQSAIIHLSSWSIHNTILVYPMYVYRTRMGSFSFTRGLHQNMLLEAISHNTISSILLCAESCPSSAFAISKSQKPFFTAKLEYVRLMITWKMTPLWCMWHRLLVETACHQPCRLYMYWCTCT